MNKNNKIEKEDKENLADETSKKIQDLGHGKILRNFFMVVGFILILVITFMIVSNIKSKFDYRGVDFEIVSEIAPYRTIISVTTRDSVTGAATQGVPYYFYLRNNPRDLDAISFSGELVFKDNLVVQSEEDFNCDGNGIIGIANLAKLYGLIGVKVIRDENATCDEEGRYMFLHIESGDKTEIEQTGPSCYNMKISNCEILQATERFMIETFVEINKISGSE